MAATQIEKWLEKLPIMNPENPSNGYYVIDGTYEGVPRLLMRIYRDPSAAGGGYVIRLHEGEETTGSVFVNDDRRVQMSELSWGVGLREAIGLSEYSGGNEALPDSFSLDQVIGKAEFVDI